MLDLYRRVADRDDYDACWDVVAALGGLDQEAVEEWRPADERFLAHAVGKP